MENIEAATKASCKSAITKWTWFDEKQRPTCEPDIEVVDEDDFKISSFKTFSTLGLGINSKKGVKFLPTNLASVFPNLEGIQIYNCSVKSIDEYHFKSLSKLTILDLRYNKIEDTDSDAFADLASLKILQLSFNRIRSLSKSTFTGLKALKRLYLYNNEIQFLHPEAFDLLVNIERIDLDYNELQNLDENIFENLASLTRIDLDYNQLRKIPRNLFRNNLNLTKIFLRHNKIKFVEDTFENLPKLATVDLVENLCIQKEYYLKDFGSLKKDLKQKCNENSATEKLESEVRDLQRKASALKQDLLQTVNTKFETFIYRIESVNKTIIPIQEKVLGFVSVQKKLEIKVANFSMKLNDEAKKTNLVKEKWFQQKLETLAADLMLKLEDKSKETKEELRMELNTLQNYSLQTINTKYGTLGERFEAVNKSIVASSSNLILVEKKLKKTIENLQEKISILEQNLLQTLNEKNKFLSNHSKPSNETFQASSNFISIHKNVVWLVSVFCTALFFVVLILVIVYPPQYFVMENRY